MTALTQGFQPTVRVIRIYPGTSFYASIGLVAADGTIPSPTDMQAFTWQAIVRKELSSDDSELDTFAMAVAPNNANATLVLTATPDQTEPMESVRYRLAVYGTVNNTARWLAVSALLDAIRVPEYVQP